ncbi:MAG: hypothetical protein WKF65_10715 [Gaiellaceae bacterium]
MIVATGHDVEPYMSVYPGSDKVSGPEGILLRSSAVSYWHGEGTAVASESVEIFGAQQRAERRCAIPEFRSRRGI